MSQSDKIINIHEVSYKTIETWTTLLMFPANCSKWYFHQLESKNKDFSGPMSLGARERKRNVLSNLRVIFTHAKHIVV